MKNNKVFKATFLVMIITISSRFLGLIRDAMVANQFGADAITDAYKAAVTAPDSMFTIIGLGISTVFIPMLSKIRYRDSKDEMFSFGNKVIGILSIFSVMIFIVGSVFTTEIVNIIAPGFDKETAMLAVRLTKISLINLLFLSINVCFTSMLQICEDFVIPSILGMFFNAPIILYLLLFKDVNIVGVTIANVIGNFLRVIVQLPSLYKQGYIFKPSVIINKDIKRMLILMIPVMIGAGANSINMIVDNNIASSLGKGVMSNLEYGQKIITFVNTAITTSIVSVMYPLMANKLNEKDNDGFLSYLSKTTVIIGFMLMPIAAGFILLSKEVVTIYLARGLFDSTAVKLTSMALLGYSFSIPFIGIRDILNSSLFAMQKTKTTALNGIIGVIINIILNIYLSKFYGIIGIALASSIASIVTAFLLFKSTVKFTGNSDKLDINLLIKKMFKIFIATFVMFISLVIINNLFGLNGIIKVMVDGVIGCCIYVILSIILKIDELTEVVEMLKSRLSKGKV